MSFLLGIRVSEFIEIKYYHFLVEMCYYINILTMFIVILDMDIEKRQERYNNRILKLPNGKNYNYNNKVFF